ncbi:MAG: hypothetical protein KAH56_10435 [Candidatus Krumholzibacteria bacterium]|nr:hypothetical protein [Candidatus Krumholzibacteria bacterium]
MSYRAMLPLLLAAVFLTVAGPAVAQLPNLTFFHNSDLTYPMTPTATIPTGQAFLPATLPGNMETIYLSVGIISNGGDIYTGFRETHRLDGGIINWYDYASMSGNTWIVTMGYGPYTSRGGRHTLGYKVDDLDQITESNETDNAWGHQFVFTPYVLSTATPKTRGTPPDRLGGFSSIIDGSPIYANCDGFRFASTGYWNAITMYAENDADDYDLELFTASTGSENGFISPICSSTSIEGFLEAVIVNRNTVGIVNYDVGVTHYAGTGQFVIEQVASTSANVGDSIPVTLGTDEYLRIWDTYIGDTGWVTVKVDDPSADGEAIKVAWVEKDVTEIAILSITGWETTDEFGRAALHRDFTATGWYGLVVYRDPRDVGVSKPIQIDIEPTPPDLVPDHRQDWHSPLVPTPTWENVDPSPLPDTLYGYTPSTRFKYALLNDSPVDAPPTDVDVFRDGIPGNIPYQTLALGPFYSWAESDGTPREIPGGRHTLTLNIDPLDFVHEIYEDNNIWGEQYCWSPLELASGDQFSHEHPGPWGGGWETVTSGEPLFMNCDGYRLHTGSDDWEGLVLTQGPNSDYDLWLHHALFGVKDGFDTFLTGSTFLMGETDYILINNNVMPLGVFDFGVLNATGSEPYTVEAVGSTTLPFPVTRTHGPFAMPLTHMLHIYNVYLEQDIYAFRLDNLTGGVDWGFALHDHSYEMSGRDEAMPSGMSWLNGPGQAEWFTLDIPTAGWYGLAVFKAGPFEYDKDGTYELTIMQGVSEVPDEPDLPSATALSGVHPNPFNPQTTISYELAVAAVVELEIYDVKGARVRRLVREAMPAGRHTAVWNGEDDAGARVASGVYLARFSAGAYRDFTKLVMVK